MRRTDENKGLPNEAAMQDDEKRKGEFLGAPYDLNQPTARRFVSRLWNPGGPAIAPKAWGWGWTLNLAHPASMFFVFSIVVLAVVLLALGD